MQENNTEFRFIIDKKILETLPVDTRKSYTTIDYYIDRMKRIRWHLTGDYKHNKNTFYVINSLPGAKNKDEMEISEEKAKELATAKNIIYLVRKTGIGEIEINGVRGIVEHVVVESIKNTQEILNEIHIEFETSKNDIEKIKQQIKPLKIINVGLFDYISEMCGV